MVGVGGFSSSTCLPASSASRAIPWRTLGGVQIATGVYPQVGPDRPLELASGPPPETDDPTQRLNRAKEMLTLGLITDTEYWAIKAKIVNAL